MSDTSPLPDSVYYALAEMRLDLSSANDGIAKVFAHDFAKLGFAAARDIDLARQHIYRAWALLANTTGLVSGEAELTDTLPFIPEQD